MTELTDAQKNEKYERVKELARIRQKKWYSLNKPKVLEKKKEEWKKLREDYLGVKRGNFQQNIEPEIQPIITQPPEPINEVITTTSTNKRATRSSVVVENKKPKPIKTKASKFTFAFILAKLPTFTNKDGEVISDATVKTYKQHLTSIQKINPDCNDFGACLQDYDKIYYEIENAKMSNGELYSTDTKKAFYQAIVKIIDSLKIFPATNPLRKKYTALFDLYKMKSAKENKVKQAEMVTKPYPVILAKVKEFYGENSKQYLLFSLYNEVTCRDDYGNMVIIKTEKEAKDNNRDNYIIVPANPNTKCSIILLNYKTDKKYGEVKIELSTHLSALVRDYIHNKGLQYKDCLLDRSALSNFVGNVFKKLKKEGVIPNKKVGAINYIRHSKISTELDGENINDLDKRIELFQKSFHSPITQLSYVYKLDEI